MQVFTEAPPGISKFGRVYRPSYVFYSPYMIPPFNRGKNVQHLPLSQIIAHAIDMSTSVDINLLRGLENSSMYTEFDRWFPGDMTMDRRVQHPRSFFEVILGLASIGWLGEEVIIFSKFSECCGFVYQSFLLNRNFLFLYSIFTSIFA